MYQPGQKVQLTRDLKYTRTIYRNAEVTPGTTKTILKAGAVLNVEYAFDAGDHTAYTCQRNDVWYDIPEDALTEAAEQPGEPDVVIVEVTSLLEYYGDEATPEDASNFFEFCERYAAEHYPGEVEVVSVDGHPRENAEARQINEEMWQAWLSSKRG